MTTATRARATREKAAALRAEAARRQSRARNARVVAVVAAVLAVVVAAGIIVQTARHDGPAASAPPRNLTDGAITVGRAGAPVTVELYEDFQCPVCKQAHQANDARLDQWVRDGTVRVRYHPVAFLDRASTDGYSTRALNAAAAVIDLHPAGFEQFQQSLYDHQPAENGPGLSDEQLIRYAVAAGAPKEQVTTGITSRRFGGWVRDVTDEASRRGVTGTPTIKVNGTTLEHWTPQRLEAAVQAAAKG